MNKLALKTLQQMIRVNQSGEIAADAIYKGQLLTLSNTSSSIKPLVQHMHNQELKHLSYFNNSISSNRVRPSLLLPLWYAAGYSLGVVTGLLGDRVAMKCTEAVETAIGEHYNDQVRVLVELATQEASTLSETDKQQLNAFTKDLVEFRDEELEHLDHAKQNTSGHAENVVEQMFVGVIGNGCKIAVEVAKRI